MNDKYDDLDIDIDAYTEEELEQMLAESKTEPSKEPSCPHCVMYSLGCSYCLMTEW